MKSLSQGARVLAAVAMAGLVGCGDGNGGTSDEDSSLPDTADADAGGQDSDATPEEVADEPDAGAEIDTTPEEVADEPDTVEEPCPDSLFCIDERTGRPSARVCVLAGWPAESSCERQSEEVACCVAPFACETDEDCEANREAEGFCHDDRFACSCIPETGECVTELCSSASDCDSGEVCLNGACTTTPDAADYVALIVTPPGYIGVAASIQLSAVAVNPDDPSDVNPGATFEWTGDDDAVATVGAGGLLTGGDTAGAVTITARVEGNPGDPGDTVTFQNAGAAPDGGEPSRITVISEVDRGPVEGATVLVHTDAGDTVVVTDAAGVAAGPTDGTWDVHVFAEGFAYVSAMAVEGRDILLPLPILQRSLITEVRDGFVCEAPAVLDDTDECGATNQSPCLCYQLDGVDVVKGVPDFSSVANTGELEISLTGFALGNSLLDLNFDTIVGPNIERIFPETSPIPVTDPAEIPSGVTLHFNGDPIIESFVATAPEGSRTLWSVGGIVSISDNPNLIPDIIGSVDGDLNIGALIAVILPLFDDFYSGIAPGVEMTSGGTFPVRNPEQRLTVPTQRRTIITPGALPGVGGVTADTAFFLGGALVPGQGFVPLGVTAGADDTGDGADGLIDGDTSTSEVDPVVLSMAPIHGGIAGPETRYMVASAALFLGDSEANPEEAASGRLSVFAPGDPIPAELDLTDSGFPAFAEGSAWDSGTRTVSIEAPDEEVSFFRLVFKGPDDRPWIVYAPGDAEAVTMPAPTGDLTFEDRVLRDRVNIVGVALREESGVSYQSLLELNGTNLTELFEFVSTFSILRL